MKRERLWSEPGPGAGPAAGGVRAGPPPGTRRQVFFFLATVDPAGEGELSEPLPAPGAITGVECLFPPGSPFYLRLDPYLRTGAGAIQHLFDLVVPAGDDARLAADHGHVHAGIYLPFDALDALRVAYENLGGVALTFLVKVEVTFHA